MKISRNLIGKLQLEGPYDIAAVDVLLKVQIKVEYFFKLQSRICLYSIDHIIEFGVIKLYDSLGPCIYFIIAGVVDQVATHWSIVLDFNRDFSSGFLIDNLEFFLFDELGLFDVAFLHTVMFSVDLLQFLIAQGFLQQLFLLLLELGLLFLQLQQLRDVHFLIMGNENFLKSNQIL